MKKSDFYRLRSRLGLSTQAVAELCGVTPRSVQNWDKHGAPIMAVKLLTIWDRQYVGHPGWNGWMFSRGALMSGSLRFKPETLRGVPSALR